MMTMPRILRYIPAFYNTDTSSVLYNILLSISEETDNTISSITDLWNAIGIDYTSGKLLDDKWGQLLNIARINNETDNAYRTRLKTSILKQSGGTAEAIRYAIGVIIGVTDESELAARVQVVDAWDYTPTAEEASSVNTDPGNFVCRVDIDGAPYIDYGVDMYVMITNIINTIKAVGTNPIIFIYGTRIMTYTDMAAKTYDELDAYRYYQLG